MSIDLTTALTPLRVYALVIESECHSKPWYAYAKPYVDAMKALETAKDNYYEDSGVSVCLYALSNLTSWRGEVARAVKRDINIHVKLALA